MAWREGEDERVYSNDEVDAFLKAELPHWYLENGWIRRKYKTSGWKATLMVVNTVGHIAEAGLYRVPEDENPLFSAGSLLHSSSQEHNNENLENASSWEVDGRRHTSDTDTCSSADLNSALDSSTYA